MSRKLFLGLLLLAACASAPKGGADWEILGARQVSDRLDHDVIPVNVRKGNFRSIKLTVQRAPVDFYRVTVHFGNGADQDIAMRSTVPAGGETRAIDLAGKERVIRSVEFWYDANTARGRNAQVRLLAMR